MNKELSAHWHFHMTFHLKNGNIQIFSRESRCQIYIIDLLHIYLFTVELAMDPRALTCWANAAPPAVAHTVATLFYVQILETFP